MIKVICYSYSITVDNFERCRSFCLFAFSTFCLAILTFWHFAILPFCHGPTTGDWRPGGRRRGARQRGVLRSCHATVDYGGHDDDDDDVDHMIMMIEDVGGQWWTVILDMVFALKIFLKIDSKSWFYPTHWWHILNRWVHWKWRGLSTWWAWYTGCRQS